MYEQSAFARFRLPERAAAVALLLLMHAALFFLINPKFGHETGMRPLNEITLSLHVQKPKEAAPPEVSPVLVRPTAPAAAPPVIPEAHLPAPSPAAPNVTGMGRMLFNCDLANIKNLSREQRADCLRFGLAPPAAGTMEANLPKASKAKQSALWAAELAARRAPARVPCTSIQQQVLGGAGLEKPITTVMADPLCVLNGFLNGFHPQPK